MIWMVSIILKINLIKLENLPEKVTILSFQEEGEIT